LNAFAPPAVIDDRLGIALAELHARGFEFDWRTAPGLRAACKTCHGLTSPKVCGESRLAVGRFGRARFREFLEPLLPGYLPGAQLSRRNPRPLAALGPRGRDIATLATPIRTREGQAQKVLEADVNGYIVLYLATLMVLIPIDFLFLGTVAKGFFAAQVGDMLGEIRPAPAILFLSAVCGGHPDFRQRFGRRDVAIDAAVRRFVRPVLLRDVRADLAVALEALDLAGRARRYVLGIAGDRGVVHARAGDR
jgi:hypothetical protein